MKPERIWSFLFIFPILIQAIVFNFLSQTDSYEVYGYNILFIIPWGVGILTGYITFIIMACYFSVHLPSNCSREEKIILYCLIRFGIVGFVLAFLVFVSDKINSGYLPQGEVIINQIFLIFPPAIYLILLHKKLKLKNEDLISNT